LNQLLLANRISMLTEVFLHKVYHQNEEERESEGGGGWGRWEMCTFKIKFYGKANFHFFYSSFSHVSFK